MPLYFRSPQIKQAVAEAVGPEHPAINREVVEAVLDAYDRVVQQAVDHGIYVWVAGIGHLAKVQRAATRRRVPLTGQMIDVPAKTQIVLRVPRVQAKKKRLDDQESI